VLRLYLTEWVRNCLILFLWLIGLFLWRCCNNSNIGCSSMDWWYYFYSVLPIVEMDYIIVRLHLILRIKHNLMVNLYALVGYFMNVFLLSALFIGRRGLNVIVWRHIDLVFPTFHAEGVLILYYKYFYLIITPSPVYCSLIFKPRVGIILCLLFLLLLLRLLVTWVRLVFIRIL
jgi:hypothetical protein